MFERVYRNPVAKSQEGKAAFLVKTLYNYFLDHTDMLSSECKLILEKRGRRAGGLRLCAGMTDRYAIRVYEDLFIPLFMEIEAILWRLMRIFSLSLRAKSD